MNGTKISLKSDDKDWYSSMRLIKTAQKLSLNELFTSGFNTNFLSSYNSTSTFYDGTASSPETLALISLSASIVSIISMFRVLFDNFLEVASTLSLLILKGV